MRKNLSKGRSLLSFVVSVIMLGASSPPAFAKPERYPTDAEVRQLMGDFRRQIQHTSERRSPSEIQSRDSLVKAWSLVDPAVAPFLGDWVGNELSLLIFPSHIRGRVCIINVFHNGSTPDLEFYLGSVSKGQVRMSNRELLIHQGNYLGAVNVYKGDTANLTLYAFPKLVKAPARATLYNAPQASRIIQQFKAAGCTASLPTDSQITARRSPSSSQRTAIGRSPATGQSTIKVGSQNSQRANRPSTELVRAIRNAVGSNLSDSFDKIEYFMSEVDLNNDGKKEVVVYTAGAHCGAWECPVYIFQKNSNDYRLIGKTGAMSGEAQIAVLSSRTKGWLDIATLVYNPQQRTANWKLHRFNGTTYQNTFQNLSSKPSQIILRPARGSGISLAAPGIASSQVPTGRRSPSPGQQTTTRRSTSPLQVYKDVKSLGMAQFLQGNQKLISAQESLQSAERGQHQITSIPTTEFLDNKITDRIGSGCLPLLPCPDDKRISYADYLRLKLKIKDQAQAYEKGLTVVGEILKYQRQLEGDRQQGGQNVARKLVSLENEATQKVQKEFQQRQNQVLSLRNISALSADAFLQNTNLLGSAAKFNFDIIPAAIRAYLRMRGANVSDLESITRPDLRNVTRTAIGLEYLAKVSEILPQAFEATLKGDDNKFRLLFLEISSEVVALSNRDRLSGGLGISPHLAKALESFNKVQDLEKLRDELDRLQISDQGDKDYINLTISSYQWDCVSSAILVAEDVGKTAGLGKQKWLSEIDNAHKVVDSVKSALSNANNNFFVPQKLRRDYQLLLQKYDENRIILSALSSFIDAAAEEVGNYLIKARTDVVTRRPDGTIGVSVNGIVSPP